MQRELLVHSTSAEIVMQYLDTVYKQVSQQAVLAAMNIEVLNWVQVLSSV